MNSWRFVESLAADSAKFSFVMRWLRPTVRHRILDDAGGYTWTWSHNAGNASLMYYEVANCKPKQKEINDLRGFVF